jgi:hypothetical protein
MSGARGVLGRNLPPDVTDQTAASLQLTSQLRDEIGEPSPTLRTGRFLQPLRYWRTHGQLVANP